MGNRQQRRKEHRQKQQEKKRRIQVQKKINAFLSVLEEDKDFVNQLLLKEDSKNA